AKNTPIPQRLAAQIEQGRVQVIQIFEGEIFGRRLGPICFGPGARHASIRKFQIRFDAFAPNIFGLVDLDWSQCLRVGNRAVIDVEPPQYSSQTDSTALAFQNKTTVVAAMKPDIGHGGGDAAPAESVSRMERPQIRKAAAWIATQCRRPIIRGGRIRRYKNCRYCDERCG